MLVRILGSVALIIKMRISSEQIYRLFSLDDTAKLTFRKKLYSTMEELQKDLDG